MLSIQCWNAAIIGCYASAATLDALPAPPGALPCRVAPDELLLVSPESDGAAVLSAATYHLARVEPTALAVDQSDGWAARTIRGDDAIHLLARLFAMRLPEARPSFVQGLVAGVPAKMLIQPDLVHLLVPRPLHHYLDARLMDAGGTAAATR